MVVNGISRYYLVDDDTYLSSEEEEEFNKFQDIDFSHSQVFQKLNRHRLSISLAETGIQLSSLIDSDNVEEEHNENSDANSIESQPEEYQFFFLMIIVFKVKPLLTRQIQKEMITLLPWISLPNMCNRF